MSEIGRAVALMTVITTTGSVSDEETVQLIESWVTEDPLGTVTAIVGLCSSLLGIIDAATGTPPVDVLQAIGLDVAAT